MSQRWVQHVNFSIDEKLKMPVLKQLELKITTQHLAELTISSIYAHLCQHLVELHFKVSMPTSDNIERSLTSKYQYPPLATFSGVAFQSIYAHLLQHLAELHF